MTVEDFEEWIEIQKQETEAIVEEFRDLEEEFDRYQRHVQARLWVTRIAWGGMGIIIGWGVL